MTNTPLEDQVHDALHRRVDPLHHAPLTASDVRRRAGRIQLRRRVAAGAAVAAVLAIAVPAGLSWNGPAQRGEVPPATTPPAPAVTGTVLVDPRSAEVVASTSVPLIDVDAPSLIAADGTIELPDVYDSVTSYGDGWVGVAVDEGVRTLEILTPNLEVEDGPVPTGGLVVSSDGLGIAWTEYSGGSWHVTVADRARTTEPVTTSFPPGPRGQQVDIVGFVSDSDVVVQQDVAAGVVTTFVTSGTSLVEAPGLLTAEAASAVTGMVAGLTRANADGSSCSAVVDGLAHTGERIWSTCDYQLRSFSPGGTHLAGLAPDTDGYGSPTLAVLDATTGERVVDFEVAGARHQVVGIDTRIAWEDDDTLVVRVMSGGDYVILRLGLDGTVQRVGIDSAGESGLSIAEVR